MAHWSFDDCRATDNSGNGHDGTLNGNPQCVDGVKGKAFSFDGVQDFIEIPDSSTLSGFSGLTLSAWIYKSANLSETFYGESVITKWYQQIPDNTSKINQDTYAIWASKFIGGYTNNYTDYTHGAVSVDETPLNQWLHIVFTHSNTSGGKIYINGILKSTISTGGNIVSSSNPVILGADSNRGSMWRFFQGKIDDASIYNRALTEAEVLELYNGNAVTAVDLENSPNPIFSAIKFMMTKVGENRMDEALSAIPVLIGSVSKHPIFKNTFSTNVGTKVAKQLEDDMRTKLSLKISKLDVGKAVLSGVVDYYIIDAFSEAVTKQTNNRYIGGAVWFFLKQTYGIGDALITTKGNPIALPVALLSAQAGLLASVISKDKEEFEKLKTASVDEVASVVRLQITTDKGSALASMYQDYFRAETATQKTIFRNKIASEQRRLLQHYLSGDMFSSFGFLKSSKTKAAQNAYNDWLKDLSGRLAKEEFDVKANIAALVRLDKDDEAKKIDKVLTGTDSYSLCLIDADNGLPTSQTCQNLISQ